MIVLESPPGLLVVHQVEHATASATLALAWQTPQFISPGLWRQFVRAVRFHDHGWIEEEKHPTLDADGRPHDFKTIPAPIHIGIWRRSLAVASELHPYVRLLVARHGRGLYLQHPKKPTPEDQQVSDDFVRELERHAQEARGILREMGEAASRAAEDGALDAATRILGFVDGLSLALLGAIPLSEETEPLGIDDSVHPLRLWREGDAVKIHPWPFRPERLRLEIRGIEVPRRIFESSAELVESMRSGRPRMLRWEVLPG
jgi:hypothetical protein